MNKNRFCTVNEDIDLVINKLVVLGFQSLPDCTNNSYLTKIIIDTVTKTFWRLDQLCFENSIVTIKNQFQENILEVNIDDLVLDEAKEVDLSNEPLFKKHHKAIGNDFKDYLKNARIDFCNEAVKYTVKENLALRTEIDSFLIAYDQACDKLDDSKKPLESSEITLLDYFAAKAMQGELASQGINDVFDHKYISERAYMIAREMMITRANSQSTDSNK